MIDYREKYLKYKKKYLQAKNIYVGGCDINTLIELNIYSDMGETKIKVSPTQGVCNLEFRINLIEMLGLDKNKYYTLSFADEIFYIIGPQGQQEQQESICSYNDLGIKDCACISLHEAPSAEITINVTDKKSMTRTAEKVAEYDNEDITIYYPKDLPLNAEIFMDLLVVAITEKSGDENKWKHFFDDDNWGDISFTVKGDTDENIYDIYNLEIDTYWKAEHNYTISQGIMRTGG